MGAGTAGESGIQVGGARVRVNPGWTCRTLATVLSALPGTKSIAFRPDLKIVVAATGRFPSRWAHAVSARLARRYVRAHTAVTFLCLPREACAATFP